MDACAAPASAPGEVLGMGRIGWLIREGATETPRVPQPGPPPKLMDRVRHAIRLRHYRPRTEEAYVGWIRRFILFHDKRHPMEMGEAEVTAFLTSLAVRRGVSASTQNQALSAILFLYKHVLERELPWLDDVVRAKAAPRLPVVLSRGEARAVLARLEGAPRLVCTLLYGAGLRLLECLQLRIKDLDFDRHEILVRGGKGDRDRRTMLPGSAKEALARQVAAVRAQHGEDVRRGAGWVEMPGALARKYPNAGREWGWQWVFPATRHYVEAASGQRRRHHLHETVIQRAVKEAVLKAGLAKRATCHSLRKPYA